MKTNALSTILAVVAAAGVALTAGTMQAQDTPASTTLQNSTPSPQLSYGVSDVVKLTQAKASDDTIIAYVKNSGNSYGLDADQIIYLQQQGVSGPVITAMLNQPRPAAAPATAAYVPQPSTPAPAPQPDNSQVTTQPPAVTYVQPSTTYYYSSYPSYSYPYYYPSYYGYGYGYGYPIVSIGFRGGWGGGFHGGWGGGFHGGFGGGGFHGGFGGGGFHGGGFHR